MIGELLLTVSPLAAILIVAVSALLTIFRLQLRGELLWLANLGISPRVVIFLTALPAFAGEVVLGPWGL